MLPISKKGGLRIRAMLPMCSVSSNWNTEIYEVMCWILCYIECYVICYYELTDWVVKLGDYMNKIK